MVERFLRLVKFSAYDFYRYIRYSSAVFRPSTDAQREALLVKYYHILEKGLALPSTYPHFGKDIVHKVCKMLGSPDYRKSAMSKWGFVALKSYIDFHKARKLEAFAECQQTLDLYKDSKNLPDALLTLKLAEIKKATDFDTLAFFSSRHSVRQFDAKPVSLNAIRQAVSCAQFSPSVCNRQAPRVYVIKDKELMAKALTYQNGNRGFGDTFGALLIVTSDLSCFVEPTERYQAWIDGGMFSMSLLLGLHGQKLGACALNWSTSPSKDKGLRKAAGIQDSENIMMMIGVGSLRGEFKVARSERLPLDRVMKVLG